jgi:hypothetical protein
MLNQGEIKSGQFENLLGELTCDNRNRKIE